MDELEGVHIILVNLLAPVQERLRVQVIRAGRIVRIRGAVILVPENDEMLALPAATEIVEAGTLERIVERTRHVPLPRALVELGVHVDLAIVGHVGGSQVPACRGQLLFLRGRRRRRLRFRLLLASHREEYGQGQHSQYSESSAFHFEYAFLSKKVSDHS